MENQISRILSSDLGSQVLCSLQINQQEITKLEKILYQKNSQVFQLHTLINKQLQTTLSQNVKLRQFNKALVSYIKGIKQELQLIKHQMDSEKRLNMRFIYQASEYFSKKVRQTGVIKSQQTIPKRKQIFNPKVQSYCQTESDMINNSNSYLLQRLQKLQKTVISLKQEKWSLQKQVKKFQTLYQSTASPQKDYSSHRSVNQQQKRIYVVKCFQNCFEQLQEKKFCGQLIGNTKNGKGVCEYTNNFTYEGGFVAGHRNGIGQMRFQGQVVYKGYWKNGKPTGKGCLYYFPDDKICKFSGFFKDGIIQGYGTIFYENGQKVRGVFSQGKILGVKLIESEETSRLQHGQISYQYQLQSKISTPTLAN